MFERTNAPRPKAWWAIFIPVVVFLAFFAHNPDPTLPHPQHQMRADLVGTVLAGNANALTGDTLAIDGKIVQIWGVQALKHNQSCTHAGERLKHCLEVPTNVLANLIEQGDLACVVRGVDEQGRALSQCEANGVDIGAALVHAGYALNAPNGPRPYDLQEQAARATKAGAWAGYFMQPWLVADA